MTDADGAVTAVTANNGGSGYIHSLIPGIRAETVVTKRMHEHAEGSKVYPSGNFTLSDPPLV